jgi:DNA primase
MAWLEDFADYACEQVHEGIVEALNLRGVSDDQIRDFRIGYLKRTLPPLQYPESFLNWCHQGAKLDGVYCFPLTNVLGDVRGFQFRFIERERGGYMDFLTEAGEPVLFGLGQAMPHVWTSESVYLVEGVFDLFPLQRHHPAIVATLTARVIDPMLWTLRRMCKRIVLGYDNDGTGRRAVDRFSREHGDEFRIVDVKYPKHSMPNGKVSKDPGDLWELWGDQRLGDYLREQLTTKG